MRDHTNSFPTQVTENAESDLGGGENGKNKKSEGLSGSSESNNKVNFTDIVFRTF